METIGKGGGKIDGRFHVGVLTSRYGQFEKKVFSKVLENWLNRVMRVSNMIFCLILIASLSPFFILLFFFPVQIACA